MPRPGPAEPSATRGGADLLNIGSSRGWRGASSQKWGPVVRPQLSLKPQVRVPTNRLRVFLYACTCVCVHTRRLQGACVWVCVLVCMCGVCMCTRRLQGACGWPVEDQQGGLRPLLARREVAPSKPLVRPWQCGLPPGAVDTWGHVVCWSPRLCALDAGAPPPGVMTRLSPDLVPGPGVGGQSHPSSRTLALCSERQSRGGGPPSSPVASVGPWVCAPHPSTTWHLSLENKASLPVSFILRSQF